MLNVELDLVLDLYLDLGPDLELDNICCRIYIGLCLLAKSATIKFLTKTQEKTSVYWIDIFILLQNY